MVTVREAIAEESRYVAITQETTPGALVYMDPTYQDTCISASVETLSIVSHPCSKVRWSSYVRRLVLTHTRRYRVSWCGPFRRSFLSRPGSLSSSCRL
jgi:hypothetical protein